MRNNSKNCFVILISIFHVSCVQKMGIDGHLRPQEGSLMSSGYSGIPPEGTVAQSDPVKTASFESTVPISKSQLNRGREQYNIFCLPCHGASGYGNGMIVQRGFLAPPSYHVERLRSAPDIHLWNVITHGYGAMYSYEDRVSISDRWAIVAYIRALQFSQNAEWANLPPADQRKLESEPGP
ncbi:MAG: cytochrome c [Bdellovibrionia bacterium]